MGAASWSSACSSCRSCANVASDLQDARARGLRRRSTATPPRASASRRRPSTTRSTTRSASASSRPSSPQSNQYRVILEAQPELPDDAERARATCYVRTGVGRRRCRCRRIATHRASGRRRCRSPTSASSRRPRSAFDTRARRLARRRGRRDPARPRSEIGLPASVTHDASRARRGAFQASLVERAAADPRGDRHGVHRARRALRELHPPAHDPLDAAVGRRRRAAGADASPATTSASSRIIGIILLIGIVKKNAIMMIDFALDAERERGQVAARGDLPGLRCCASGRS